MQFNKSKENIGKQGHIYQESANLKLLWLFKVSGHGRLF